MEIGSRDQHEAFAVGLVAIAAAAQLGVVGVMMGELSVQRIGARALGQGEGAWDGGERGRLEASHHGGERRVADCHQAGHERVEGSGDVDRAAEFQGLSREGEGLLLDVAGQARTNTRTDVAGGATDQVDGVFVRAVDEAVGVVDQTVVGRGGGADVDGGRSDHEVAGVGIEIDDGARSRIDEVGRHQLRVGRRGAHALEEHEATAVIGQLARRGVAGDRDLAADGGVEVGLTRELDRIVVVAADLREFGDLERTAGGEIDIDDREHARRVAGSQDAEAEDLRRGREPEGSAFVGHRPAGRVARATGGVGEARHVVAEKIDEGGRPGDEAADLSELEVVQLHRVEPDCVARGQVRRMGE